MQLSESVASPGPAVGMHPEAARFEREFNHSALPEGADVRVEANAVIGERANTDFSRLGFTFGLLFALLIGGGVVVWVPVLNVVWAVAMVVLALALPILCARAAIFRLRKGRSKSFRVEFGDEGARWESNDDAFWKPVKDFFGL